MGFGTLPDIGPERFDDRMKQTVESLVNDLGVSEDDRLCIKHAFELHYKMRRIFDVLNPLFEQTDEVCQVRRDIEAFYVDALERINPILESHKELIDAARKLALGE